MSISNITGRHGIQDGGQSALLPPGAAGGLYDRAAALVGSGAWQCDLRTGALSWTAGVFDLFGIPHDERIDRRDIVAMYCDESRETMERLRADAIARQGRFTMDARIVRADGALRWMRLTAGVVCVEGRPIQLYGMKQDITAEREAWEAVRRMAESDALTGLANRGVFQSRFLDSSGAAPAVTPLGALVLFDIDGFKQINDNRGHAAGDACLKAVAERLRAGFPDALMVARIGGDEFAILLHVDRAAIGLEELVRRQIDRLSASMVCEGSLLTVSASAGVAVTDDPLAYDAGALFAMADAALYCAKQAGRNTLRIAECAGGVWHSTASRTPGDQGLPVAGGAFMTGLRKLG